MTAIFYVKVIGDRAYLEAARTLLEVWLAPGQLLLWYRVRSLDMADALVTYFESQYDQVKDQNDFLSLDDLQIQFINRVATPKHIRTRTLLLCAFMYVLFYFPIWSLAWLCQPLGTDLDKWEKENRNPLDLVFAED